MIGETLNNRYNILSLLGEGGMGEVFLAADQQTGQQVAVKVLARQLSTQPESLERFKREAETLRQLDHPNIVKFVDAFELEGQYVIVMEYVSGGNLLDRLKQGRLPIDRSRQIALDLCDALIRAHRLNIVHRDIKPENILLSRDGTPKLADFGVARLSEGGRMTRTGTQVGTPYYMSPEAWEGKVLDEQADIWSLGVVLFEMLAGQVPFYGDTGPAVMTMVFNSRPPELRKLRPDVPPDMIKIVRQMLTRDKKRRYPTMREVAVELERGKGRKNIDQRRETANREVEAAPRATGISPKIRGWLWGIGVSVFLISAVSMILWMEDRLPFNFLRSELPTPTDVFSAVVSPAATFTITPSPQPEATSTITPDPSFIIGSSTVRQADNMTMMYIPPGEFLMGSSAGDGEDDEQPQHRVFLSPFWMDQTEITNSMYARCMLADVCGLPLNPDFTGTDRFASHPVSPVAWDDAYAYCEWVGGRLPTEAEWEKAARGGLEENLYPWGDEPPRCNSGFINGAQFLASPCRDEPAPVKRFLPNGYGLYDLAGNVWEWVSDWYDRDYYSRSENSNPLGPASGVLHVLRGGSWHTAEDSLRTANRHQGSGINFPGTPFLGVGFRCVRDENP